MKIRLPRLMRLTRWILVTRGYWVGFGWRASGTLEVGRFELYPRR